MREDKYLIKRIASVAFLIGLFIGMIAWNLKQAADINRLEQELDQAREQLYISNDTLRQIYMFNEREYYMQQLEEEDASE